MSRSTLPAIAWLLLAHACTAQSADPSNGWRGNGTGLWPDAHPPLEWYRIPKGILADLRARADRPADFSKPAGDAMRLEKGLIRDWLVIGPFPVEDSVRDFDKAQLAGEAALRPAAGDKVGNLAWKTLTAKLDYPWAGFGPTENAWADLTPAVRGYRRNQVTYAHTYLFAPRGGTVRAVVEHAHGLKAWLNGRVVYGFPERGEGMGNYYAFSRIELGSYDLTVSPQFKLALKPGWNRLLVKVTTYNKETSGWTQQRFCLRLMDLPNIPYDSKNILWMTELPHRSNATPIVAGNRVFVMAEPDELICIDKHTGRVLWTAANNYYEALTPAERRAQPAFAAKVDPLLAELKAEKDFIKRQRLRTRIQKLLTQISSARFGWKTDGHFEGHFGIVGFTTPTPVSDGKHVWVWCGNGVAACYDLDGHRRWITRIEADELSYASSPALAGGTLAVFLHQLIGLDARSGKVRWRQKKIRYNTAAVLAARLAGVPVFVSQRGDVIRARDGKLLYSERGSSGSSDTGWAPPVILGDVVYQPKYGVGNLFLLDFTGATDDDWKPKRTHIEVPTVRLFNGKSVDRMTAGSPLVVDGVAYLIDIYSTFYAVNLRARKVLYTHDTGLRGVFHYNALPLAASATLVGKHIVVQDNQGTALVLEQGPAYRQVGKNRIATQIDRYWPIPAQETVGYSPPVPDGDRLFIRGERFLYCIGKK
jgi:outer membrane protein assembly factor BamB